MQHGYPERDWKAFRELREVALERFCERVLAGVEAYRLDRRRSSHERYLALYRWLGERNEEMAAAFDDPKRSQMLRQLIAIRQLDLLTDEELGRFTLETRELIERVSDS